MLLVVDNGSVYTKNLTDFLTEKNFSFEKSLVQNFNLKSLPRYNSVILSGRRKNEKKINKTNSKIVIYCIKNNLKLLGICYGAEILTLTLGGTIRKSAYLQKGNEKINIHADNPFFKKEIHAFESHQFEIAKLPESLLAIASSKNCKYEIIQHSKKPIFGTQFHPEMSSDGHKLIEKFCLL